MNGTAANPNELIALRAISNGALAGDKLPTRIKLLNWGVNESTRGPVVVDDRTVAALAANQRPNGRDRIALDYNHCSLEGTPEYVKGNPPAIFAYGAPKVVKGDGLWLEDIAWTPIGVEKARQYEDLSPVVKRDGSGSVLFIESAALCPNGSVFDLTFFSATSKTKHTMPDQITVSELAVALGLTAEAPKADVLTKLSAALKPAAPVDLTPLTALSARVEVIEKAKPTDANAPSLEAFTALDARLKKIEDAGNTAALAAEQAERERLVDGAARDGKLIPLSAEQIKTVPLETFRALVNGLPKGVVPFNAPRKPAAQGGTELKGRDRLIAAADAEAARHA